MQSKHRPYSILVIICLLLAWRLRAEANPAERSRLKGDLRQAEKMQKEAGELQKQNPTR